MGKTEYVVGGVAWNAEYSPASVFDVWASTMYETFTGIDREVWDVVARWKFINTRIDEGKMEKSVQPDGLILLLNVEEKSSGLEVQLEVHEGNQS